eukprot:TRINITY_DN11919_c0_g1_i1.p1 TRINITY_DN11919_c0_g1~~TRINITY_DN11919_c0_g1_i1.p1  ORF type:complete len:385 (-),score=64.50 TRINITY_DN11919_c0_g1_i1:13-1125(-)
MSKTKLNNIQEPEKPEESTFKKFLILTIFLIVLVVARSIDYVLYVRLSDDMANYAWYLGSLVLTMMFCVVSWPVVWYKMVFTDHITPEMRKTPLTVYIVLGALDAVGNILSTIPAPFLPGPLQVILTQIVIPANMLLSFVFLKMRYHILHGVGVILVIVGVSFALVPSFGEIFDGDSFNFTLILYIGLLIISTVPQAASNVYKEYSLKETELDVWYLNAWVATFQLLLGALTFWMVFINVFSDNANIVPSTLGAYLFDATSCFMGFNTRPNDLCNEAPVVFMIYMVFNMTYNITLLYVFQKGSATLAVVASALRVALSAFGFQIRAIAGPAFQDLTVWSVISVIILTGAIVVYRIKPEKKVNEDGNLEKQ